MLRAVVFDVGETLIDETRGWGAWADWLEIPRLTFFGVLGQIVDRGEHHRNVFAALRPDIDIEEERRKRAAAGQVEEYCVEDLYADAAPCLRALGERGLWIGLAGNQPAWAESSLAELGLRVDGIASSERWGVEKPSPEFFARVVKLAGVPAKQIAYVGDRLDNDVLPAADAGMIAVFLQRGPWGHAHARRPEVARADLHLRGLDELPRALDAYRDPPRASS